MKKIITSMFFPHLAELRSSDRRCLSVAIFALVFGFLLSFAFEGQVLYQFLEQREWKASYFIFPAMAAHFAGLLAAGFLVSGTWSAKKLLLAGTLSAAAPIIPFFFVQSAAILIILLMISAFGCGVAVAAWGWQLKTYTPRHERYKTAADGLIFSNLVMIALNSSALYIGVNFGLSACLFVLLAAIALQSLLPSDSGEPSGNKVFSKEIDASDPAFSLKAPVAILYLFVVILTINSGLMYQVFNPTFLHLEWLSGWYWAIPYIAALIVMRILLARSSRPLFLYLGMAMILLSFLCFMFIPSRGAAAYLLIDTLMLGACGIFDLFWWSIIGELLEYSRRPVQTMGLCISSNVMGVFLGGVLGYAIRQAGLPPPQTTVIALSIVCITTAMLPVLNYNLVRILKKDVYLFAFPAAPCRPAQNPDTGPNTPSPLSIREAEVLKLILSAKTNKEIAESLHISEYTVKTHVKNIFWKYEVTSRAELITHVLKTHV